MHGEKINQLNQGLIAFRDALQSDSVAQSRVEIAIVTFGPAQLTQDFASAGSFAPPTLSASGDTPLGAALQQSLDMLAMRKKLYKDNGTPYYRPWVFLITDGAPTDGDAWKAAATRHFREMFVWLSSSLQKVSQSQPGTQVPLAPPTWNQV